VQKSLTQTIENEFVISKAGPVEACLPVLLLNHFLCMESSFKPQSFRACLNFAFGSENQQFLVLAKNFISE
jgi:hypothetical protein